MKGPPKITLTLTPEELKLLCDTVFHSISAEKELISLSEKYPGDEYWANVKQDAETQIAEFNSLASTLFRARSDCGRGVKL